MLYREAAHLGAPVDVSAFVSDHIRLRPFDADLERSEELAATWAEISHDVQVTGNNPQDSELFVHAVRRLHVRGSQEVAEAFASAAELSEQQATLLRQMHATYGRGVQREGSHIRIIEHTNGRRERVDHLGNAVGNLMLRVAVGPNCTAENDHLTRLRAANPQHWESPHALAVAIRRVRETFVMAGNHLLRWPAAELPGAIERPASTTRT